MKLNWGLAVHSNKQKSKTIIHKTQPLTERRICAKPQSSEIAFGSSAKLLPFPPARSNPRENWLHSCYCPFTWKKKGTEKYRKWTSCSKNGKYKDWNFGWGNAICRREELKMTVTPGWPGKLTYLKTLASCKLAIFCPRNSSLHSKIELVKRSWKSFLCGCFLKISSVWQMNLKHIALSSKRFKIYWMFMQTSKPSVNWGYPRTVCLLGGISVFPFLFSFGAKS